MKIACNVMTKLHQASILEHHNLSHIQDWPTALDKDWSIPDAYLKKARELKDRLFKSTKPDAMRHGDLHHDNIFKNSEDWLVIDPKGVIGEPAYEVAAFIHNPIPELLNYPDAPNIILNRITRFSEALKFSERRIIDGCFVQAVLSWAWALEDRCDMTYFEQLTKVFDKV